MKKKLSNLLIIPFFGIIDFSIPVQALSADSSYLIGSSLKMIWGLLIVLGILFIIYGLARKKLSFIQGAGKGTIKLIETRHLMPKKTLFLIEIKGKEYLLGAGNDSINLITPIDADEDTPSFNELLQESESNAAS